MKNFTETSENFYTSINSFKAEDSKPFKYQFGIEVISLKEATGDAGYLVNLSVAKQPKYLKKTQRVDIGLNSCVDADYLSIEDVISYGIAAPLENAHVLTLDEVKDKLNEFDEKIEGISIMIGFYLDKRLNGFGNTGWDFITGNIGLKF